MEVAESKPTNASGVELRSAGPQPSGLATDLYQLTMAAAYYSYGRFETASFELFTRRLPAGRSFLLAAGLEQALEYLASLSFSEAEVAFIRSLPAFAHVEPGFFDYLRDFNFSGEVWALPEGTAVFANEPLLRVTAPLIEAQLVETYLLSTINFQTLIATKAARMVEAAGGRGVVEFGARRAHGMGAALYAARAAFIGGCVGTSNVEAAWRFGIPAYGTAAHSWIMSFEREADAFRTYHEVFPDSTTLLLDTYDTLAGARLATEIGPSLRGVRLDSGDLVGLARQVRDVLNQAGMRQTQIMASGDLNEFKIAELLAAGAPVDLFGVGTDLSTSRDAPALGGVYKLVELEAGNRIEPKMKLSREKATYPYRKQVWREADQMGLMTGDTIGMADEAGWGGEPLLKRVMNQGKVSADLPPLREIQAYAGEQLRRLPTAVKSLAQAEAYPVRFSAALEAARAQEMARLGSH